MFYLRGHTETLTAAPAPRRTLSRVRYASPLSRTRLASAPGSPPKPAGISVWVRMAETRSGAKSLAVEADRERLLTLLGVSYWDKVPPGIVKNIENASEQWRRGDLVFWQGHVALVRDEATLLHASAHHMAVAFEATAPAIARIRAAGSEVTSVRRLPPPA